MSECIYIYILHFQKSTFTMKDEAPKIFLLHYGRVVVLVTAKKRINLLEMINSYIQEQELARRIKKTEFTILPFFFSESVAHIPFFFSRNV